MAPVMLLGALVVLGAALLQCPITSGTRFVPKAVLLRARRVSGYPQTWWFSSHLPGVSPCSTCHNVESFRRFVRHVRFSSGPVSTHGERWMPCRTASLSGRENFPFLVVHQFIL